MDPLHLLTPRAGPSSGPPQYSPGEYCWKKENGLYDGPIPDKGPQAMAAIWALFGVSSMFLALRVYCKVWRLRGLWWDDWVLIMSWVAFAVDAAMSDVAINHGLGRYPCDVDPRNLAVITLEGARIGSTFGMLAVGWSKTSFAITLLRLTEGRVKKGVWFMIVSMNIAMTLEAVLTWIQCTPVASAWDINVEGTCWHKDIMNDYGIFAGALSGTYDVVLALLPWTLVWKLRMRKREKFGIGAAMSMGVVAGATAYVKCAMIPTLGRDNFTYYATDLVLWAAAEIATTIMGSCIPVLRVLVIEVHDRTMGSYGYTFGESTRKSYSRAGSEAGGNNTEAGMMKRSPSIAAATALKSPTAAVVSSPVSPGSLSGGEKKKRQSMMDMFSSNPKPLDTTLGKTDNNSSEEQILPLQRPETPSSAHILRTSEVAVEFEDARDTKGYEMRVVGRAL